ncbi:HD domain-containing protein [Acidaminobacter sp. JC074]|uniref:HD-GYP domain-containing protein n=1 Tax=Acidaminobacter sp. JC074 TaxID=2530199 RepID=UPI001F0E9CA8|nr:HD domain-containing phosphohydrolase [Acidaminobacter sp. JC074]MCH4888173.1 HD domain-containing protein [Acidaminobacter sp. JC074]
MLRDKVHVNIENWENYLDNVLGHNWRVSKLSNYIAELCGFDPEMADLIEEAAYVHDIGKIQLNPSVLYKPSALDDTEMEEIKRHVVLGIHAVSNMYGDDSLHMQVVKYHHERWDGNGYPYGLKGTDIPIVARIVAVADQYDAIRSRRVYKRGFAHMETMSLIYDTAGTFLDPVIVRICMANEFALKNRFEHLYKRWSMRRILINQQYYQNNKPVKVLQ